MVCLVYQTPCSVLSQNLTNHTHSFDTLALVEAWHMGWFYFRALSGFRALRVLSLDKLDKEPFHFFFISTLFTSTSDPLVLPCTHSPM